MHIYGQSFEHTGESHPNTARHPGARKRRLTVFDEMTKSRNEITKRNVMTKSLSDNTGSV